MGEYPQRFSRRAFVAGTSSFAALHSVDERASVTAIGAAIKKLYEQQFK